MVFCCMLNMSMESSCILCRRHWLHTSNWLVFMRVEDLVFKVGPITLNMVPLLNDEYDSVMCDDHKFMYS